MLRIYGCIAGEHDLRLVLIAGLIALCGSYSAVGLLRHAARSPQSRIAWLCTASLAEGSATWAAHFIAMLAFTPGAGARYQIELTALSLAAAVVLTGIGFVAASGAQTTAMRALGGLIAGSAISTMHYLGMAGFSVPGVIGWAPGYVAVSVLSGAFLASIGVVLATARTSWTSRALATLFLTLAICSAHFIGMTAVSITLLDQSRTATASMSTFSLTMIVILVCCVLLVLLVAALEVERRMRQRHRAEMANLHDLADIAVEGLLVCDGDIVVAANESFVAMSGRDRASVHGTPVEALFTPDPGMATPSRHLNAGEERTLVMASGELVPVEVVSKPIQYAGRAHLVIALRDLRERHGAERKIKFLAHHDPLTGLANRAYFADELIQTFARAATTDAAFALLAIDLDRFKAVNDTEGHPFADKLLICVAERLMAAVRHNDLIARQGGDEFAILLHRPEMAEETAARIVERLCQPFAIEGKVIQIGCSIGVALAPAHGDAPEPLIRSADIALYAAKARGRCRYVVFEESMGIEAEKRRQTEQDLRRALARREFVVFYQPLLTCLRSEITGFEALLRWQHPDRGMISPADFIPLAEELGLMVPIGHWVLQEATARAATWGPDIGVAVNIAAAQLKGRDLVDSVKLALESSGLPPHLLELEVTETVLMHGNVEAIDVLHEIHDLGVRVSIDDFGTGHSSLAQFRSFPFDKIKIDQSFIAAPATDAESAAIVRAIIGLARSLGITTTAEGVETAEQMARLRHQGCDAIQGYLIGRPMPDEEAAKLVGRTMLRTA